MSSQPTDRGRIQNQFHFYCPSASVIGTKNNPFDRAASRAPIVLRLMPKVKGWSGRLLTTKRTVAMTERKSFLDLGRKKFRMDSFRGSITYERWQTSKHTKDLNLPTAEHRYLFSS